jgi:selenocysteine lyase/cysteine desulfurase
MDLVNESAGLPLVDIDIEFVRSRFPAFSTGALADWSFFENAGGSYACGHTIDSLNRYYVETKVQPYGLYPASAAAGAQMDRSHQRWAEALGVDRAEIHFGPSTSMNTYVLAQAIGRTLQPGDEVVVTNQDHEANTGAIRRAAQSAGATVIEWQVDPDTGLLDQEGLGALLGPRTRVVTFPHASNIVGQENDVQLLTAMAHEAGARVIVDGVSFAPHTFPHLAALNPDVYLFSLYKTYSVHQGLMVVRNGWIDELPNQGHFFNESLRDKRLTPAGPDHGQIAAAGAVLDYVEELAEHHSPRTLSLREATDYVSALWRRHETALLEPMLARLRDDGRVRVLGPDTTEAEAGLHRCPTVAVVPRDRDPAEIAASLVANGIMPGIGHFYAKRLVEALGVDPESGAVRLSFVHYTDMTDIERMGDALETALA